MLIGILTAITLLLLLVFVIILGLSRRQKFQSSPTVLKNPFGFAINMKVSLRTRSFRISTTLNQPNFFSFTIPLCYYRSVNQNSRVPRYNFVHFYYFIFLFSTSWNAQTTRLNVTNTQLSTRKIFRVTFLNSTLLHSMTIVSFRSK